MNQKLRKSDRKRPIVCQEECETYMWNWTRKKRDDDEKQTLCSNVRPNQDKEKERGLMIKGGNVSDDCNWLLWLAHVFIERRRFADLTCRSSFFHFVWVGSIVTSQKCIPLPIDLKGEVRKRKQWRKPFVFRTKKKEAKRYWGGTWNDWKGLGPGNRHRQLDSKERLQEMKRTTIRTKSKSEQMIESIVDRCRDSRRRSGQTMGSGIKWI